MISNKWRKRLDQMHLTARQLASLQKYYENPHGLGFVSVAEVLLELGLRHEAAEALSEGVQEHPTFAAARIRLSELHLQSGLPSLAIKVLDDEHVYWGDNSFAQKLRLRAGLLLEDEKQFLAAYFRLRELQSLDQSTQKIYDIFEREGIEKAKSELMAEFRLSYPDFEIVKTDRQQVEDDNSIQENIEIVSSAPFRGKFDDFQVLPIDRIFLNSGESRSTFNSIQDSFELDSWTLAEIYEKQEHYSKAAAILKRLLKITPGHQKIIKKIAELSKKSEIQKSENKNIDPVMVDKVEQIENLDKQLLFYSELMRRFQNGSS
ncbi:MAG: hypothetical protein KBD78_00835 [Oligoflexales bacterium]|nr:hypothetical protein [Oligoflexales bacterium]